MSLSHDVFFLLKHPHHPVRCFQSHSASLESHLQLKHDSFADPPPGEEAHVEVQGQLELQAGLNPPVCGQQDQTFSSHLSLKTPELVGGQSFACSDAPVLTSRLTEAAFSVTVRERRPGAFGKLLSAAPVKKDVTGEILQTFPNGVRKLHAPRNVPLKATRRIQRSCRFRRSETQRGLP